MKNLIKSVQVLAIALLATLSVSPSFADEGTDPQTTLIKVNHICGN